MHLSAVNFNNHWLTMRLNTRNALLGFAAIPLGVSIALGWVALGTPGFSILVALNAVAAYPVFIGAVLLYDWAMKRLHYSQSWWSLGLTVVIVSFVLQAFFSYLSHRSYYDYQYEGTVIVQAGAFTSEGIAVLAKHAAGAAMKYGVGACLFWFMQVGTRGTTRRNDPT
jgi:hypothetical protein